MANRSLKAVRGPAAVKVDVIGLPPEQAAFWARSLKWRVVAPNIPQTAEHTIVIAWTWEATADHSLLWGKLVKTFSNLKHPVRVIVAVPENTPDDLERLESGRGPHLLIQALVADHHAQSSGPKGGRPWTTYEALHGQIADKNLGLVWCRRKPKHSQLIRLASCMAALPVERFNKVCAVLPEAKKRRREKDPGRIKGLDSRLSLPQMMLNPPAFRAKQLHGSKPDKAVADGALNVEERRWARALSVLEFLAGRILLPPSLPLNVLVVENDWDSLRSWNRLSGLQHANLAPELGRGVFEYLDGARYYVVDSQDAFQCLRSAQQGIVIEAREFTSKDIRDDASIGSLPSRKVKWEEIDLVLQDVMLGRDNDFTGLDLTPHYLEACPQALVFVLTGMDVESLAMSGDVGWKYVDAVIPKRRLGCLWWEYVRCFKQKFGRMFWDLWVGADDEWRKKLRALFGTLHQWQQEPDILTYGQAGAELIDHGERHVSLLWRLTDDVIGSMYENWAFDTRMCEDERIALALAVWLHDIGHRGDEHCAESISIRDNHAAISEYLLLRNPDAYGLSWLREGCQESCRKTKAHPPEAQPDPRLKHRNLPSSCDGAEDLCLLRKIGLLCRHHQSNSPLNVEALEKIQKKGKSLSPYARSAVYSATGRREDQDSDSELRQWMDPDDELALWRGSDVQCLDSFLKLPKTNQRLMALAGLLRFLDGIQMHRERVGSAFCVKSFKESLEVKDRWAQRQIEMLDRGLRQSPAGSRAYQQFLAERYRLDSYLRLVRIQYIHYWRQVAVHDVKVQWRWLDDGRGSIDVAFLLDDIGLESIKQMRVSTTIRGISTLFNLQNELVAKVNKLRGEEKRWEFDNLFKNVANRFGGTEDCLPALWAIHVLEEIIKSEHESQSFGDEPPIYTQCLLPDTALRIVLTGTLTNRFEDSGVVLYQSGRVKHEWPA